MWIRNDVLVPHSLASASVQKSGQWFFPARRKSAASSAHGDSPKHPRSRRGTAPVVRYARRMEPWRQRKTETIGPYLSLLEISETEGKRRQRV